MSTRGRTIVELNEVCVEPPLVDGAQASIRRLGLFSTFDAATRWLPRRVDEDSPDDDALLYYVANEIVVDSRERHCNSTVYDRDGSIRGKVSGGVERLWCGREPSTCAYKAGDIVGLVGVSYRIGVVLAGPPAPDEARRWSDVTRGDDLYLIGTLDKVGSAETHDHEHVPEALLFEVEHDVTPEMREALKKRHAGYAR